MTPLSAHTVNALVNAQKQRQDIRETIQSYGLTIIQWMMLAKLSEHGSAMTKTELARDLDVTTALIVMMGRSLLKRELITVNRFADSDKRQRWLAITTEGQTLLDAVDASLDLLGLFEEVA